MSNLRIEPKSYAGDEVLSLEVADKTYLKKNELPPNVVTLSGTQTITGTKIFKSTVDFQSNTSFTNVTVGPSSSNSIQIRPDRIDLNGSADLYLNGSSTYIYGTARFQSGIQANSTLKVSGSSTFNNHVTIGTNYKLGFGTNYIQDSGGGDSLKITFANGKITYLGSDANNSNDYVTKGYVDNKFLEPTDYLLKGRVKSYKHWTFGSYGGHFHVYTTTINVGKKPWCIVTKNLQDADADNWWTELSITASVSTAGYICITVFKHYDTNNDDETYRDWIWVRVWG